MKSNNEGPGKTDDPEPVCQLAEVRVVAGSAHGPHDREDVLDRVGEKLNEKLCEPLNKCEFMNEPTLLERRLSNLYSSFRWRNISMVLLMLMIKP